MAVRADIRSTPRSSLGWPQKKMRSKQGYRALRTIVWASRSVGWVMLALAVLNALQIGAATHLADGFRVTLSLVLALLGLAWIVGVEVFLHFFDRFLSRN